MFPHPSPPPPFPSPLHLLLSDSTWATRSFPRNGNSPKQCAKYLIFASSSSFSLLWFFRSKIFLDLAACKSCPVGRERGTGSLCCLRRFLLGSSHSCTCLAYAALLPLPPPPRQSALQCVFVWDLKCQHARRTNTISCLQFFSWRRPWATLQCLLWLLLFFVFFGLFIAWAKRSISDNKHKLNWTALAVALIAGVLPWWLPPSRCRDSLRREEPQNACQKYCVLYLAVELCTTLYGLTHHSTSIWIWSRWKVIKLTFDSFGRSKRVLNTKWTQLKSTRDTDESIQISS